MADLKRATLKLAARLQAQYYAEYLEYQEERAAYHRQGLRAQYCEHGTNMWTDYDPICPGCEDGWSMRDGVTRRRHALDNAKARVAEAWDLLDLISKAYKLRVDTALNMPELWGRINTLLMHTPN